MSLVQQAQEVQARAEQLIAENARLTNLAREQELALASLKADNDNQRQYIQKLRAERDNFLRVANAIVTSCGEAKDIFNKALSSAHAQIAQFKAEELPALTTEDEARLKRVTEGIDRINGDHVTLPPRKEAPKLPPTFLRNLEREVVKR